MFSDSVDREAAWLSTSGDGLPSLNKTQGGPFQILQARWPRTPPTSKTALYVLRSPASYRIARFADIRSIATTDLIVRMLWPMTNGQGSAESDQLGFERAIDLVITRVLGFPQDKTHGGRFLSVGEGRNGIEVSYEDPEQSLRDRLFRATLAYSADDPEITN